MRNFSKKSARIVFAGIFALGMCTMPFAAEAHCPNGCLDKIGSCHCNGDHAYKEASWGGGQVMQ